jgi:hypothetical protein
MSPFVASVGAYLLSPRFKGEDSNTTRFVDDVWVIWEPWAG